jgi:peptidoglycan/LPS O-acetylase OafA/YrhL
MQHDATSTGHRADIDGLRALAVLPITFFHAGIPGFGGGYVGVDIFFVISSTVT